MPVQSPLTSGSLQEQTEVKSYGGRETSEFERWTEGITNTNSANFSSVGWNKAVQQQENPMELGAGTKLDSRLRSSCIAKACFHGPLLLLECGPPPRTLLGSSCIQVLHFPAWKFLLGLMSWGIHVGVLAAQVPVPFGRKRKGWEIRKLSSGVMSTIVSIRGNTNPGWSEIQAVFEL